MAITKTYLLSTDTDSAFVAFYKWLKEKSVPKYFDSVDWVETETTYEISCLCGEHEFLRFVHTIGSMDKYIYCKTTNAVSMTFTPSSTYYGRVRYGYECKHGLTLHCCNKDGNSDGLFPLFTICKSANGETAIMAFSSITNSALNNASSYYAIALNDDELSPTTMWEVGSSNMTVLCPIPTGCSGGEGNYLDNVLFMAFWQTQKVGELEINNIRYFSNGVWVVKDE